MEFEEITGNENSDSHGPLTLQNWAWFGSASVSLLNLSPSLSCLLVYFVVIGEWSNILYISLFSWIILEQWFQNWGY